MDRQALRTVCAPWMRCRRKQDMKVIQTANGQIRVLEPTSEVFCPLRSILPFGIVGLGPAPDGARFGVVMQCGDEEASAVKQQCVDLDERTGDLQFKCNYMLIAGALKGYLGNGFGGLLMPVAYRRTKEGGRVEAGIAYFGHSSPTGREAADFPHERPYDDHFGRGFWGMMKHFIAALAGSSATTGLPLQSPIIGMDIRKRLQLGSIVFGFLVHGPYVVYLGKRIDAAHRVWEIVSRSGITEIYHLPSVPLGIGPEDLKIAKPDSSPAGC